VASARPAQLEAVRVVLGTIGLEVRAARQGARALADSFAADKIKDAPAR
jgi:hypothetical protein